MITRAAAATVAAFLGACLQSKSTARAPDHSICPDGVALFAAASRVPYPYREVALLPAKDAQRHASDLRRQAAQLGANGVILTSSTEGNAGKMLGLAVGEVLDRQGKVVAVDIPADSDRVNGVCRVKTAKASTKASARTATAVTTTAVAATSRVRTRGQRPAFGNREPTPVRPFDLSGRETTAVQRPVTPPPVAQAPDDTSALLRNPDVRSALTNLERLRIVTGAEEVRPGLVRLSVGQLGPIAQMEYHVGFLHGSYQAALPYGQEAVVELWSHGEKLGEYAKDGLILGDTVPEPR